MSSARRYSRRFFIHSAGLVGLSALGACGGSEKEPPAAAPPSPPQPKAVPVAPVAPPPRPVPSGRITLGFIGTGDHGVDVNLRNFITQPDAQIVALCDVDQARLDRAHGELKATYAAQSQAGRSSGCFTTRDWREIIARDDIDAVIISTPDHWHGILTVEAARAGKDVFCEKPLSLTVAEGRAMCEAARRYGRVFQVGTPNRSRRTFHRAATAARAGRIGKLERIEIQICSGHSDTEEIRFGSPEAQPVPKGFDYDMWLGQAPEAPYHPSRCHFNFRYNLDYSAGNIVDFGAHILDVAQWGNNTEDTGPLRVEGWGKLPQHGTYNVPTEWDLTYQYANGVVLHVKSGGYGIRFIGPDGWVAADNVNLTASNPELLRAPEPGEPHLRTCFDGEQRDFLNCVASRGEPYAPPEIEHRSMILAHIGVICMKLGRPLQWDPVAECFPGDAEATRMLGRAMRGPWRLEA